MDTFFKKKDTICLVAILKNEEKFLDEWLVYHKMIGIDFFFLYDDDSASSLKEFLRPHSDYIHVVEWAQNNFAFKNVGNQLAAYKHAFKNHIMNYDWVVFLDADEFIVLKKHKNIKDFLFDFKDAAAISLHWYLYGHNGFINDPPGLIITHLNKRMRAVSTEIKSITRTDAIADFKSPHYCDLKYGFRKDDNNNIFSEDFYSAKSSIARINHYKCRSFENWMKRVTRGDVNFNKFNNPPEHLWRLSDDLCFNEFVSSVAPNYNEVTDNYMLRYKFKVYDGVLKIKYKRKRITDESWSAAIECSIIRSLDRIAKIIKSELTIISTSFNYTDRLNICLFCFVYSKYRNKASYANLANTLLAKLIEDVGTISGRNYYPDLIKFGCIIEYLVQNRLLNVCTFNFLEDIDFIVLRYLKENSTNTPKSLILATRYFILRVINGLNAPSSIHDRNYFSRLNKLKNAAAGIFDQFYYSVDNYSLQEKVDILLLYCDSFNYFEDKQWIKNCVSMYVEKIEFEINKNPAIKPLHLLQKFASAYMKLFHFFPIKLYQTKAKQYINQACAESGTYCVLYPEISRVMPIEYLELFVKKINNYLNDPGLYQSTTTVVPKTSNYTVDAGIAITGLRLLTSLGAIESGTCFSAVTLI